MMKVDQLLTLQDQIGDDPIMPTGRDRLDAMESLKDPETFEDTYCWVAAKYIKSERKGYDFELDMDNSREFNYVLFYEALRYIEVIIEGKGNESNHAMA